jgi:hypothetical protein
MGSLARTLIVAGALLLAVGLLLHFLPSIPLLGKLPGDIRIERPGVRIYVPIVTCLLLSLALSAALSLVSRLK